VAEEVARIRAEHTGPDRAVLVVDGGDWWQGTPEGALEDGLPFVRALGSIGYDAMALGNHEFDLGTAPLERMLAEVELPALAANVRVSEGGERVDWVDPWRLVERGGLRVALVGLVYEQTPFITHPDARELHFADEVAELRRVLAELPDDVDLVIPVTHCGVDVDRELAAAFPDLPLIVGGHSHTWLRGGQRVGDVLVAQAGSKARALGRVDLMVDRASGEVLESSARLVELDDPLPDERRRADVGERVAALAAASEAALGEVVGELAGPLVDQRRFGSSSVGNWITDAFRAGVESDLAIHNRGGIRARLVPGPISRRDLFELLPFPNTLVSIELTGRELERCLREALVGRRESRLEVSGITLVVDLDAEGRAAGLVVEHAGAPLDPDRRYRVATNSYLAKGGDNLFALGRELESLDTGVLLRDLLERDLREAEGAFRPADDDRYRIVDPR
jgi:2',3'-cyclic-nucleotide 2'-phosphodiesterase (5'-nucleotidase family)